MFQPIDDFVEVRMLEAEFNRLVNSMSMEQKEQLRICYRNNFKTITRNGVMVVNFDGGYFALFNRLILLLWKIRRKNIENIIKINFNENPRDTLPQIIFNKYLR